MVVDQKTGLVYVANAGELPSGQDEPDEPVDCCEIPGVLSVYDPAADRWIRGGADGIPAGVSPIEPVINSRTNRVYVSSLDSDLVTVVNTKTNAIVDKLAVLPEPYGLAVNERSNRIYVGHIDTRRLPPLSRPSPLEIINGKNNSLLSPLYAGSFTRNVAVHPVTGRVYVANLNTSSLTILEDDKVVQRVRVGLGPRAVVINPETNKIYVGNTAVSQGFVTGAPDGLPDSISVIRDPWSRIRLSVSPRRAVVGSRTCFTFRARSSGSGDPLGGVTVRFAGSQRRTGSSGRVRICTRVTRSGRLVAKASRTGYIPARASVRAARAPRE